MVKYIFLRRAVNPYVRHHGSRRVRAASLGVALLALILLPPALAQVGSEPVSFLVYRPWPDPRGLDGDPLASALAPPPRAAERLPLTLVDRAVEASRAPENAPESALAHYREISRLVQEREAQGAPLALTLGGTVGPGVLVIDVLASRDAHVSLVVFEHAFSAYAARFVLEPTQAQANVTTRQEARLDPSWNVERLGVVAIAQRDGETQSATWLVSADAPTVQTRKSVLVEHVTANWCDPCGPVDEALALLATQRGVAGPLASVGAPSYLRAPEWPLLAGLVLGGGAALALLRRPRA